MFAGVKKLRLCVVVSMIRSSISLSFLSNETCVWFNLESAFIKFSETTVDFIESIIKVVVLSAHVTDRHLLSSSGAEIGHWRGWGVVSFVLI